MAISAPGPASNRRWGRGRRKAKRVTASLKAVKELRPACTEIIICTGLKTRGGMQVWGSVALGMFCDRRQRGVTALSLDVRPALQRPGVRRPDIDCKRRAPMAYRDPAVGRAADRERFRKRTAARRAAGLCPRCGEVPPESDRRLCAGCADRRNKASRARDARLRAAGKPASRSGPRPRLRTRAVAQGEGRALRRGRLHPVRQAPGCDRPLVLRALSRQAPGV